MLEQLQYNKTAITAYNPLEGSRPTFSINLHDGSNEQITIIIVHKDRPHYLNICLQSIGVASINYNYEVVVVDNNSGRDSQELLDEIKDEVKLIRNDKNIYWGPAANKGVQAADRGSKYFVFLHCDTVVLSPGWLDLMINVTESMPTAGIVGTELQSYFIQNQKIDFVQEWCMLMTRECWNDIGPFPESLPQIGTAFITTQKAQKKGYKPQVLRNPICHHYRDFSLNLNEYEVLVEKMMTELPKLMREIQTVSV